MIKQYKKYLKHTKNLRYRNRMLLINFNNIIKKQDIRKQKMAKNKQMNRKSTVFKMNMSLDQLYNKKRQNSYRINVKHKSRIII